MIQTEGVQTLKETSGLLTKDRAILMKEDFLKLLLAQLQHQDPLKPLESMEFTSQLSQFAQLEQIYTINENLKNLISYQASNNQIQTSNLLGKEVKARGDILRLEGGKVTPLNYLLEKDAKSVKVVITDANGRTVRVYEMGTKAQGIYTLQWDGLDGEGRPVPEGEYRFKVSASGADGKALDVSTYLQGKVTGILIEGSQSILRIGNARIPAGDVYEVLEK